MNTAKSYLQFVSVFLWCFLSLQLSIGGAMGEQRPQYGGIFTLNHNGGMPQIGAPSDNLGPGVGNRNLFPALEPLVKTDEEERIQPGLAERIVVSPDGKAITFYLRRGIKFHDGTDFDAEAVKYNLEAVLKANIPGSAFLNKVSSYDVVDKYTLRMNLKQYDCTILLRLAQATTGLGLMASPTAMKKQVPSEEIAKAHCVGTGPFAFHSWKRDSYVRYKKWGDYWQKGKPYLDEIRIQSIADLTVSIMSFKSGEAQAIENIDPVDAKQLEKEGFEIYQPNLFFVHSILPDGGNPNSPFSKKSVRLALEYAIDKRTMAKGIGMGYYEAVAQVGSSRDPWYNPNLRVRDYDPKKARQLLAEAGYPNGFKTKLVSDVRARRDILVAIQTYLKEVGIETELEILEIGAALAKPRQGWEGILYPGFPNVCTIVGIYDRWGDPTNFVSIYRPAGWHEKWNALLAQMDEKKRLSQLKELLQILYEEVVGIPFQADAPLMALHRGKVHGFKFHANHIPSYFEPENVWLGR